MIAVVTLSCLFTSFFVVQKTLRILVFVVKVTHFLKMSTVEDVETKAGHPPAVKAGGMRVARNRQSSTGESKEKNEMTKEEIEEYGTSPPKEEKRDKEVLVSGVLIKEEKAFPPEAIRHYHMKPLASRDMRPREIKHPINQPK